MKRTNSAGGVIVNDLNQIVVVNQRGRSWSLPKGHVNKGESYVKAAYREIYEETGIEDLELIKKLGSYQRYQMKGDNTDDLSELKTIHIFLFRTKKQKLDPVDPDNPTAIWVNLNEVHGLLTHEKDKEFFQSIVAEVKS